MSVGDFPFLIVQLINKNNEIGNTNFSYTIQSSIDWSQYSSIIKINLYRIIQELLLNVNKYAEAKNCSLEIYELNQQLVAAVKTNNYELTLKILAQGADANYKSQEDGNQLLHTAVLHNQIGQIELLCLYGADVTCLNRSGQTPLDLAEQNNFQSIIDRLYELQFELTDELSYFLCNKRPDHKLKKHFLIPNNLLEVSPQDNIKLKLEQVFIVKYILSFRILYF
jgi:G protein-coupled receptor kinase interacting protein 2